ncbi:MAG: hypothetical protein ABSE36_00915 [Terracidiphilus sp.]|jgi:hypothetical protein
MKLPIATAAVVCAVVLSTFTHAQDVITLDHCSGATLPVTFQVDCTHVADPQTKEMCWPFAENQACKVFQAYRKITGIHLEQYCPTFTYKLYDKDQWPQEPGDAGGFARRCGADLTMDGIIQSSIGPYDVHEILHVYQDNVLGALPDGHILFGPAMAEAQRLIGDGKSYWNTMGRMKAELARTTDAQYAGLEPDRQCVKAEFYIEDSLYSKSVNNVELFYSNIERGGAKDMASRLARFNRMFDAVSGGTARQYLLAHGCAPF